MTPTRLAAAGPTISAFGHDPWWLIIIKVLAVFGFLVVTTLLMIWAERRVIGRMQQRLGPNRCGPFGLGQSLADGIKLALKEDIIPALADKPVFFLAPAISAIPAFLAFAVIPVGGEVSIAGHHTPLQLTDLPVAVLFVLACSSFGVYGIVLAGWSSGSAYPLLGGLRSAAQVISYEVCLALALVPVFLYAGSLSTSEIVNAQNRFWFGLTLLPSFVVYMISAVGETNRAPFDLPEAEGELVGGFHTEYSSLKFAMFFLAEYINMTTVCAIATTLFLGGWHAPWLFNLVPVFNNPWFGIVWFLIKLGILLWFFVWLRGTLPRLRYDQFMRLGWKVLIPGSLVWLLVVAAVRTAAIESVSRQEIMIGIAIVLVVVAAVSFLVPERKVVEEAHDESGVVVGSRAFPVPVLPGEDPHAASGAASPTPREVTRA